MYGTLQKVISKKTYKINLFFVVIWSANDEKAGSESGSVSHWYGSADPGPSVPKCHGFTTLLKR
jgi:hypothetical protein